MYVAVHIKCPLLLFNFNQISEHVTTFYLNSAISNVMLARSAFCKLAQPLHRMVTTDKCRKKLKQPYICSTVHEPNLRLIAASAVALCI